MHICSGLLLLPFVPLVAAGLYSKNSPVLQLDGRSYERLIAKSNHTSIVEFYAPWCGHCKNLQPAYEKAAGSLAGQAQVAAVDCDEEINKPFCGSMGVKGFPTLKIVKPAKKAGGRPVVEDYQGPRTAKAIVEAMRDKIPMHVTRLKDAGLSEWLSAEASKPKALIYSEKSVVSPLVKALAIDFLGSIDFAQVKSSEKASVERFGVKSFPAVVLVPGEGKDAVTFDGELKKATLVDFLSQAAPPNPTPPLVEPKRAKEQKKKDTKKPTAKSASVKPSQASETLKHDGQPTKSPSPNVADDNGEKQSQPIELPIPTPPKIATLESSDALQKSCLHTKASTCILAILPNIGDASDDATISPAHIALSSLAEIAHKHARRGAKIFPFYGIPSTNGGGDALLAALNIVKPATADKAQILAVNAKRSWWKSFEGEDFSTAALERWVDAIRYDEVKKEKLPEGVVRELQVETQATPPLAQKEKDEENEKEKERLMKMFDLPEDSPLQVELLEVMDDDDDSFGQMPVGGEPLKMKVVQEEKETEHDEL